jgi:stearoyl-CoA desaturase (Delta-9 desaturase)
LINSLAHYIGEQYYTTEVTARGNFLLALFTNGIAIYLSKLISGEGNHNFHHSFPSDFRNGFRKTDWDPTKWIIFLIHKFTTQIPSVRRTPDSEVERARRRVLMDRSHSTRPQTMKTRDLPSIPARDVKERFRGQPVIVLEGYVVDVGAFAREHPGGEGLLRAGYGGRDLSEGFWKLNRHTRHARGLAEDMRIARVVEYK